MNVLESRISLPSPLCGFTVTEWCVCPAGTGRVHGRRCQLLEGGCGASVQPTALLGLGESRPQLRPTVVPNGWSGVAATLPSWTLICMFEKKLELLMKRLWNGWWCLRPYLLCPCRSCLRRCGVGCSILWEDSRPASLTGNRPPPKIVAQCFDSRDWCWGSRGSVTVIEIHEDLCFITRFYLGGPTSVRGFGMYSIGPQSEGKTRAIIKLCPSVKKEKKDSVKQYNKYISKKISIQACKFYWIFFNLAIIYFFYCFTKQMTVSYRLRV